AREEVKTRAEQLIEQLNLGDYRNTAIRKLSGGTRHRLGLAQALLNDPDILILDEPTAGLDPVERMRFRRILAQLSGERIVIVSTHILADLDASAGAIALVKGGTVFAQGSQTEIAQTLRGRVWEVRIPAAQVDSLQSRGQIINIRREDGDRVLRMIADHPPTADAIAAQPTLDDVYLAEFPEQAHAVT
ncbi:MAG: ATP-binding cassette domain-containing protein, partial [Firmicutes bacterium]|nr:ATP-binding cassette domain-containing protein [Bacillota bacterium]